jgi:hypothetical protein
LGDVPGVGEADDLGGGKVLVALQLVIVLSIDRDDTEVVEVGGTDRLSVLLETDGTVVDVGVYETVVPVAEGDFEFCRLALIDGNGAHPGPESCRLLMSTTCLGSFNRLNSSSAFRA